MPNHHYYLYLFILAKKQLLVLLTERLFRLACLLFNQDSSIFSSII